MYEIRNNLKRMNRSCTLHLEAAYVHCVCACMRVCALAPLRGHVSASAHSLAHDAVGACCDSGQQATEAQADVEYVVQEGEHRLTLGGQEDVVQQPVLVAAVASNQVVQVAGCLLIGKENTTMPQVRIPTARAAG